IAIVLDPGDARRVLTESPEPFVLSTREKRAALAHFQPGGVLIARGRDRADRRRFTESVLETDRPEHHLADQLRAVIHAETADLGVGPLTWDTFAATWWRIVRRLTLGDDARHDTTVTDLLRSLRADANWAYARPRRDRPRHRFEERIRHYLDRA